MVQAVSLLATTRPPDPLDLAADDLREAAAFLRGLLLGSGAPPAASRPLRGRTWGTPGTDPLRAVNEEGGRELEARGRRCEFLAWVEIGCEPEVPRLLTESLVRFQLFRTVIEYEDDCPPRWGIPACEAAVAACQIGWLIGARQQGRTSDALKTVREEVLRWLREPADADSGSGDLLVVHLLGDGLERWSTVLQGQLQEARRRQQKAQSEVKGLQRSKASGPRRDRRQATQELLAALERQRRLEEEIKRSEAALASLSELTALWRAIDPLGSGGAAPLPGHERLVRWPVTPILADPHAMGLQRWLVRGLVAASGLAPDAPDAGLSRAGAVFGPVREDLGQARGDARWWIARSLTVFYRLWSAGCPPPERVEELFSRRTDSQRRSAGDFFAPWDDLRTLFGVPATAAPGLDGAEPQARREWDRMAGEPARQLGRIADFLRDVRGRLQLEELPNAPEASS